MLYLLQRRPDSMSRQATQFVVQHIKISGGTRIRKDTVLNYLPLSIGDRLTVGQSNQVIKALYKTGLFSRVSLYRNGSTLIIKLTDRPVIGLINFTGNKEIDDKTIKKVLKNVGLVQGEIFKADLLKEMTESLEAEYKRLGYYSVKVDAKLGKPQHGHININIIIDEGGCC